MPSNDPISQVKDLIASDERQRSGGLTLTAALLRFFTSIPVLREAVGSVADPLLAINETLQQWREENVAYLLEVVTEEVQRLNKKVDELSEGHQIFIGDEWVKLVSDGMVKAQQTRAKERIRRMGKALAYAFAEGEHQSSDLTEEILRVAMSLDDNDIRVLSWLCDGMKQQYSGSTGRVDQETVNNFWGQVDRHGRTHSAGEPATPENLSIGDVLSACSKLQAFGLVVQVRQNTSKVSPATLPYGPLKKGYEFLDYLRSAE